MMPGYILVIDDNAADRYLLQGAMQSLGLLSDTCATLDQARDRLARNGIALVLLDLHFGAGSESGVSLANWIRSKYPKMPVVFVTADVEAAKSHLAWPVLCKPIDLRLLAEMVRGILARSMIESRLDSQDEVLLKILAKLDTFTLPGLIKPWMTDPMVIAVFGMLVTMAGWMIGWIVRHP